MRPINGARRVRVRILLRPRNSTQLVVILSSVKVGSDNFEKRRRKQSKEGVKGEGRGSVLLVTEACLYNSSPPSASLHQGRTATSLPPSPRVKEVISCQASPPPFPPPSHIVAAPPPPQIRKISPITHRPIKLPTTTTQLPTRGARACIVRCGGQESVQKYRS